MHTVGTPLLWIFFLALILAMLALDLGIFHRRPHEISTREAAIWSVAWVVMAMGFNLWVLKSFGTEVAEAFLTGYLIEKALSIDNLFVFYLIFASFRVELKHQHRLLFWGILGALVLRAAMVFGGTYLLGRFTWIVYVFGGVLVMTGGHGARVSIRYALRDGPRVVTSDVVTVERPLPDADDPALLARALSEALGAASTEIGRRAAASLDTPAPGSEP
jgi:TerC family integral membrane protein